MTTMEFQVVCLFTDNINDEITFCVNHPNDSGWVKTMLAVDWGHETLAGVAARYIEERWHVGRWHGDSSSYASNTAGANVEVLRLDFDSDPRVSHKDRLTTKTYAIPDEASALSCAMSFVDLHKVKFLLSTCDCKDAQRPGEWHLMVTGPAKLHSDMLGQFEWLGGCATKGHVGTGGQPCEECGQTI